MLAIAAVLYERIQLDFTYVRHKHVFTLHMTFCGSTAQPAVVMGSHAAFAEGGEPSTQRYHARLGAAYMLSPHHIVNTALAAALAESIAQHDWLLQLLAVLQTWHTLLMLQIIKFVEQDVAKVQALADELKLQVPNTALYRMTATNSGPASLGPDPSAHFNGHKWGFHNKEEHRDIEYGPGESNALEQQFLKFGELGSKHKESTPLR